MNNNTDKNQIKKIEETVLLLLSFLGLIIMVWYWS